MLTQSTIRNLTDEAERLGEEREELAARLASLDRRLNLLTELVMLYREPADEAEYATQPPKSLRNELVAIFREVGKPLHYKEAYQRLLDRGMTVNGTDPAKNVGAQLSNDDRFEKMGNGLWGLAVWRSRPPSAPVSDLMGEARGAINHALSTLQPPARQPTFALSIDDQGEHASLESDPWDDDVPFGVPTLAQARAEAEQARTDLEANTG